MKRNRRLFVAVVLGVLLAGLPDMTGAPMPNVIYIMADDLGYGDLGCYGSTLNSTPNIDALASDGVRMTDFHAAAWCAPSRRALMTGCHANRPWNSGDRKWGRLADATTLPEALRSRGYATALVGKWHLGMEPGLHPLDQGFDSWYGTRGSNDWDGPRPNYDSFRHAPESAWKTPLYINRENKGPIIPQSQFTRRYTEEAIRLIHEHRERPLFLYLAHNMPHVPIFASASFQGTSKNGVYGDVIRELDWSVGQIVQAVDKAGLLQETIIVFTSDNGPWTMFGEFGGSSGPLRGEKSTTWEGGERVPFILSWKEKISPAVRSELMTNYDVYATLASLAGVALPPGVALDSLDQSGVFLRGSASLRKRHIYFFSKSMAYRNGRYKLHRWTRERTRNPHNGARELSTPHDPPLLFDLKNDLSEQRDIASEFPQIVDRLMAEMSLLEDALINWEGF